MTSRKGLLLCLCFVVILTGLFLTKELITAYNEPASEAVRQTGTVLATYICDNGFALIYPDKNAQIPICVSYTPAHKI